MGFLEYEFLSNSIMDYVTTFIVLIVGIGVIVIIKIFVMKKMERKARDTRNKFNAFMFSLLKKTLIPALFFGVFYLSIQHLVVNESFLKIVKIIGITIFTFLTISFVVSIINYIFLNYWLSNADDEIKRRSVKSIMPIIKIVVYSSGLFFLLDNLGFKISALIAGLGIGGVAVALAGQTVLKDLFSYFAILFDRPFEIGDFIVVGEYLGNIEHVGIKTTRIRSLGGEEVIFSNADLTDSRVRNYKRMDKRRVGFKLGVVYQTGVAHLKEIPIIIKKIINNIEETTFDRAHFVSYGDFSLIFEVVYYVVGNDYNKYMDIHQRINLEIFEEFHKRNIEFAYPTQTVFVEKNKGLEG